MVIDLDGKPDLEYFSPDDSIKLSVKVDNVDFV
jgi:hypothetical protein